MPENRLETALRKAATEPGYRPEFCRVLLESEIFVLGSSDRLSAGAHAIEAGAAINIQNWKTADGSAARSWGSRLMSVFGRRRTR